jgi:hypothetical protein
MFLTIRTRIYHPLAHATTKGIPCSRVSIVRWKSQGTRTRHIVLKKSFECVDRRIRLWLILQYDWVIVQLCSMVDSNRSQFLPIKLAPFPVMTRKGNTPSWSSYFTEVSTWPNTLTLPYRFLVLPLILSALGLCTFSCYVSFLVTKETLSVAKFVLLRIMFTTPSTFRLWPLFGPCWFLCLWLSGRCNVAAFSVFTWLICKTSCVLYCSLHWCSYFCGFRKVERTFC